MARININTATIEELEDDSCAENGYRFIEIEDSGVSVSLSSSFGLCTSN